jgi:hypothetical protein
MTIAAAAAAAIVEAAIGRVLSTIRHCQAYSTAAFAAGRLVAVPIARRSCECHGEALGATSCRHSAGRVVPAAVVERQE